jgi:hypothetical protein
VLLGRPPDQHDHPGEVLEGDQVTAQASTENQQPEQKKRVVGKPFRKGRDPRRAAGPRKPAEPEQQQDISAFSRELVNDPKVRAQVKKMAQRGELPAPLMREFLARGAGVVQPDAPQETDWERRVREQAAKIRKNLSPEKRTQLYALCKEVESGRPWRSGQPEPREPKEREPRESRPPVEAQGPLALPESTQEPEREVIELAPEVSPRGWQEEREWRRHLGRCQDPRSCNDFGRSHPSHAWRRLTRLP